MTGRIIKIISNLYTVEDENNKIYECRARGKFRNLSISPLVGDIVDFSEDDNYITDIHPRKNELERPVVANIDQAIIVTSLKRPDFSSFLLDKMLVNVILNDIEPIICFTKYDLLSEDEKKDMEVIINYYKKIGIKTFINTEIKEIEESISRSTVVLTGQTGAGKSSLINRICPDLNLKTDDISLALNRGKHTTRHVELFKIHDYYIADTPGFSALDVIGDADIRFAFKEFKNDECKFSDCKHINEIGCQVKQDVMDGNILLSRYENYKKMVIK